MKIVKGLTAMAVMGTAMLINTEAYAEKGMRTTGRGTGPVVYVTSQNLFFDSIVLTDLPNKGNFQLLEMAGPSGLQTEAGPGDEGFYGGRWWLDKNQNGIMDEPGEEGDAYFLCPLLGPGRDTP